MNSEEDFRKHVMKVGEAEGGHVSWIEAHLSAAGIPDLNIRLQGQDVWLELKVIKEGQIRLRPTQKRWHRDRHRAGGKSWVAVLNRATNMILVLPGHVAAGLDSRVHSWDTSPDAEWWQVTATPILLNTLAARAKDAKQPSRGNGTKESARSAEAALSSGGENVGGDHWLTS